MCFLPLPSFLHLLARPSRACHFCSQPECSSVRGRLASIRRRRRGGEASCCWTTRPTRRRVTRRVPPSSRRPTSSGPPRLIRRRQERQERERGSWTGCWCRGCAAWRRGREQSRRLCRATRCLVVPVLLLVLLLRMLVLAVWRPWPTWRWSRRRLRWR